MKIDLRIGGPSEKCSTLAKLKIKPRWWLFFHVNVCCLLDQGHYFCVHFGCHHLFKTNFFLYLFFHYGGEDDVHGDNDGVYNFHFFSGLLVSS